MTQWKDLCCRAEKQPLVQPAQQAHERRLEEWLEVKLLMEPWTCSTTQTACLSGCQVSQLL